MKHLHFLSGDGKTNAILLNFNLLSLNRNQASFMLTSSQNIYLAVAWLWLMSVFAGFYILLTNGIAWSAFSNFEEQVYSSETLKYHFNRMMLGIYILIIDLICLILFRIWRLLTKN